MGCESKSKCEHPERRPKDGKCSEKLIKQCHGEKKEKTCCDTKKDE